MTRIGKYNGIDCFKCSDTEYKNELKNGNDNGGCIYIIEGTMVRRNRIIGHYDGSTVRDVYDGVPYVVERKPGPQKEMTFTTKNNKRDEKFAEEAPEGQMIGASYEELVKQDIDFGKYSTIVDEFFALLEQ